MAAKTDTIIISINYRLGALGYLAHPALSAETPGGSGNYGLMDQMASLKWVRANIGNFGGDPGNVTIYGQSSGAGAVCSMLISPMAKGLFNKAIIESGSCMKPRTTLTAGEASGVTFANAVGCTDAATVTTCLRKVWPGILIANQANYLGGPKEGGAILPLQPADAIAAGAWNKVPIMTGSTKSENRLLSTALAGITAQGYVDLVNKTYGAKAAQVLALYPLANYKDPYDAITQVQTDAGNACGVEVNARTLTSLTRISTVVRAGAPGRGVGRQQRAGSGEASCAGGDGDRRGQQREDGSAAALGGVRRFRPGLGVPLRGGCGPGLVGGADCRLLAGPLARAHAAPRAGSSL
jgi:para-nitrobenzyl esterase